ncbi:MAG: LuxR C-terminal-related transcriptional regulator [Tepidisphaeraceae bacterium]|jgi:DNA-binding CsgD family transcriptional regulator
MGQLTSASLSPFLTNQAWSALSQRLDLSERELQIVKAIFDDEKRTSIAHHLGMSPCTVRAHLERLYHKLDVGSQRALVAGILGEFLQMTAEGGCNLPSICPARSSGKCPLFH